MKYVITGGSGYIGGRLIDLLCERGDSEVVIADLRSPARQRPDVRFVQMDVRDPGVTALLETERPDTLIHLAFVLNPIRNEHEMYDIDVNGTVNVLRAAEAAGTQHVMVASSTTAYGAWPDNPVPIPEDHPVRGMAAYAYARDKTEIDRLTQLWTAQHPDRDVTIFRPCIVFGPNVNNYLIRFWQNAPFVPLVDGVDAEWQLVHEDDLVEGIAGLAIERKAGIFNITGDGVVRFSEMAALLGLKTRRLPAGFYRRLTNIMWKLHLPRTEAPGGQVDFTRYPWVASNEKLKAELGWQPRYSTRETLEITLRAHGLLKNGATAPAETRTPAGVAS
ncbi:MAG: NAD-dependent epimerase/dehydratase family protein [Solirubrobacterales bacterium]